jgi:hypothetical protein
VELPLVDSGAPIGPTCAASLVYVRLTGLLRKKPWKRGFFYGPDSPATRQARPAAGVTAVSVEPPGAIARRGLAGRAGYEPLRETER